MQPKHYVRAHWTTLKTVKRNVLCWRSPLTAIQIVRVPSQSQKLSGCYRLWGKNKAEFKVRDCLLLFTNFSARLFSFEAVPHCLFQDKENKLLLTCSSENPDLSDRVSFISFNFGWEYIRTKMVACSSATVIRKRREITYLSCFWMACFNFSLFTLGKESLHDLQ